MVRDVNMPNGSAIQIVEEVKTIPAHKSLPLIRLTTEGAPQVVQCTKAAGARTGS